MRQEGGAGNIIFGQPKYERQLNAILSGVAFIS